MSNPSPSPTLSQGRDPSQSPCIKLCTLDPLSGFCLGCGRSGAEIGSWLSMSRDERIAVNARLPARLARMANSAARHQA